MLLATRTLQRIGCANGLTQATTANKIVTHELDRSVQQALADETSKEFVPLVKSFREAQELEKKVILLLDNAPSYPSSETLQSDDGIIKTIFLPPNTPASKQPLDQGVLDPCK